MSSSNAGLQASAFLRLPLEIRHLIYSQALVSHRGFVRFFHKATPWHGDVRPARIGINPMFTCRQVLNEAREILYGKNIFCVMPLKKQRYHPIYNICLTASTQNSQWLRAMSPQARDMVRRLEIRLPPPPGALSTLSVEEDYESLAGYFKHLQELVLFVDSVTAQRLTNAEYSWPEIEPFYIALSALLPSANHWTLDMAFLDYTEASPSARIIDAITSALTTSRQGTTTTNQFDDKLAS